MLKKYFLSLIVSAFALVCLFPAQSFAYPISVEIVEKKDLVKMTDQAVIDAYVDTLIEIEANNIMHFSSGFSPREFQEYKSLLRYRYELRNELQRRKLTIPIIKDER